MFRQLLEESLQRVDGALACALMGFDGVPVVSVEVEGAEVDPAVLGTEISAHIAGLLRTVDSLEVGPLAEFSFRAGRLAVAVRLLNRDYFLVLFLRADGNLGKGRYLLRVLAPKVRQEL